MHTSTYKLVMRLIAIGKTDGLADKVDIYYANNRLTDEEYEEIMSILNPPEDEPIEDETVEEEPETEVEEPTEPEAETE